MKFLEKYKLYRSVIKQEPINLTISGAYQSIFFEPTKVFEHITYCVDEYRISAFTQFEIVSFTKDYEYIIQPTKYKATVTIDKGRDIVFITFKSLLAKKLFEHGERHQK